MPHSESNQIKTVPRASLPIAAQRWLDRALPPDLDPPSTITIEQEGTMDIRGRWTPFQATGIYKGSPLSFRWRARLQMLRGVWIIAEDGHRDGWGWGSARLWGVIPLGKRLGKKVLAAQVVRNLGELAWLPAFVLTDGALTWTGTGDNAFEVRTKAGDRDVTVGFEISDGGDVIKACSPSRPYDVPDGYAEAPWHYEFSDHREFAGVRIPASAVATFEKSDGPWEYFHGRITSVTFGTGGDRR
jgi:hypothetical protein